MCIRDRFKLAYDLGAIINLDDFTHIECLEKTIGTIPETICCRFNPGGLFKVATDIMDNPGDAKYGMTEAQITEAYKLSLIHISFVRSKLSKSWMMPRIFFTKVIIPALFVESALTQIFFHFSWSAFAEPGTAS